MCNPLVGSGITTRQNHPARSTPGIFPGRLLNLPRACLAQFRTAAADRSFFFFGFVLESSNPPDLAWLGYTSLKGEHIAYKNT